MATIVALTTNNWSSTTVDDPWPGGTKPGTGDTVQTGDYVITIDENVTVVTLEATASGSFSVDTAHTITANIVNNGIGYGLQCSHSAGTIIINGNVTGITGSGVTHNGSSGLTINGTVTGSASISGVYSGGGGGLTINGTVTDGGEYGTGVQSDVAETIIVTGNVVANAGGYGISISNSGSTLTITGDVITGALTTGSGIFLQSGGALTINGAVRPDAVPGIAVTGDCTIDINGNVSGGTADSSPGVFLYGGTSSAAITVNGVITGGSGTYTPGSEAYGVSNTTTSDPLVINGSLRYGAEGCPPVFGSGGVSVTKLSYGALNPLRGKL